MKYLNLSKPFAALAITALVLSACSKVDVQKSIGDAGQTLVKILGGAPTATPTIVAKPIDFVNAPVTLVAADIRRDIPNPTELNKAMIITVKDDNAIVTASGRVVLPSAWYTIGAGTPRSGGVYTINMAPGEFAKEILITVPNATLLDPATKYGLGFTITTADAGGVISTQRSLILEIGAKNAWDGTYEDVFTNYHPTSNPGYTGDKTTVEFHTISATECKIYWPDGPGYYNPAVLGGVLNAFAAQEPGYNVNTATNAVTVQNRYSGATTFYTMNASFNSRYDPGTKTFFVKWGYSYTVPGVFDAGCREWTQTLRYLGPR